MIKYSKTTQSAIAAMSRLAEVHDCGETRLSSSDIAETRRLPKPLVAKLLTILSQAGLVSGSPGPGGGYALARPAKDISLYDVAALFERSGDKRMCPFGPHWCGQGAPCPLHDSLAAIDDEMVGFLKTTKFSVFEQDRQISGRSNVSGKSKAG